MGTIKHIAIRTKDPLKTAAFYQEVFGLRQVGLGKNGVYLSDGHINLAILSPRPAAQGGPLKLGIDHLGFQVEDVEGTVSKLKELGGGTMTEHADIRPADPSEPQSYFEIKCLGPDDQVIDISTSGWVGTD